MESGPWRISLKSMESNSFLAFCELNHDLRVELSVAGDMTFIQPQDMVTAQRDAEVVVQLGTWARVTGGGRSFGSSTVFFLPDGSALSPDAGWISKPRIAALTKEERQGFLRLCPEFVIEVMSPTDRLPVAQQKMRNWIANGAELGWLIDGNGMRVYVFRKNGEVRIVTGDHIDGEGPVEGFRLDLAALWEDLQG